MEELRGLEGEAEAEERVCNSDSELSAALGSHFLVIRQVKKIPSYLPSLCKLLNGTAGRLSH
jgi:hypothetical protein